MAKPDPDPFADIGEILLVGAGKMGGAMLDSWLALGLAPERVTVLDPGADNALAARGLHVNPPLTQIAQPAVMVLAVKPQIAPDALPPLKELACGSLIISIMAGRTLDYLDYTLGSAAIVRAMPNTPAAIGRGVTVAVPNARVGDADRRVAHRLLSTCGLVEWVSDEKLIDAVTAVSGSGPAYVFLLTETLAQAGIDAGLPQTLARTLARETVAGAGELMYRATQTPAELRQNVTSPNGTTAAALGVLMADDGLQPLMKKAVQAAAKRSRELAE